MKTRTLYATLTAGMVAVPCLVATVFYFQGVDLPVPAWVWAVHGFNCAVMTFATTSTEA